LAVKEALGKVDPRPESPAESRSRGWLIEAGLAGFEPGVRVRAGGHTYWADLCHMRARLIAEVDGWSQYGDDATTMREVLDRERERQRDLEDDGWRVVRWSSTEPRAHVVRRVGAALLRPIPTP
jgi:very-short-patch-repair endonuclease